MDIQITGVVLLGPDDGVELSYIRLPADVRKNGLVWQHSVRVPAGADYDDEIEALELALRQLLDDVLEDEHLAEPIEPKPEEDEDEEDSDELLDGVR